MVKLQLPHDAEHLSLWRRHLLLRRKHHQWMGFRWISLGNLTQPSLRSKAVTFLWTTLNNLPKQHKTAFPSSRFASCFPKLQPTVLTMAHSTWNKPLGRESIGYEYWVVPSPSKSYNLSKLSFGVLRFWRPSEGRMLSLIINEANTFSCTRQNNMDFRKSFSTSVSSTSFRSSCSQLP